MWQSINTESEPSMKEAVRNKSAFLFHCSSCGRETMINYNFLYHQPEDNLLIQFSADDENADEFLSMLESGDETLHQFSEQGYVIRLTRSLNHFVEKLLIFDEGLDDRLIEIYKVLVLMQYFKQNPETNAAIEAYFYSDKDGDKQIHIVADGQYECSVAFNPELYHDLENNFGAHLPALNESQPVIDEDWAFDMFEAGK